MYRLLICLTCISISFSFGAESEKLPELDKGKWKGFFAGYENRLFDAVLQTDGQLLVKPKNREGKYIGKPIVVGQPNCVYYPPGQQQHSRRIVKFTDYPKPTENPREIVLAGEFEEGVKFEVKYTFSPTGITFSGGYKDPPSLTFPSQYRLLTRFPQTHTIAPEVPQSQREELVKGYLIKSREIVDGRRKRFEYAYAKSTRFNGFLDELEVVGPWEERVVAMSHRKLDNENQMRLWIYADSCPWQGFLAYYHTSDNEIKRYKAEITLTVK